MTTEDYKYSKVRRPHFSFLFSFYFFFSFRLPTLTPSYILGSFFFLLAYIIPLYFLDLLYHSHSLYTTDTHIHTHTLVHIHKKWTPSPTHTLP